MADQRHRTTVEIRADTRGLDDTERYLRRAFDARHVEAFTQAVKKATSELANVQRQGGAGAPQGGSGGPGGGAPPTGPSRPGGPGGGPGGSQGGSGARGGSWWRPAAVGGVVGGAAGFAMGRASQAGALLGGGGAVRGAVGSIPVIGPFAAGALEQAEQLFQVYAQQQQQLAEQFSALGISGLETRTITNAEGKEKTVAGPMQAMAQRLGLDRGAAFGAFGRAARAAGMTGREMGEDAAAMALKHQRLFGVETAGMVGAAGVAGGVPTQARAMEVMKRTITAGFIAGFRESKLGDFAQMTAQQLTEMRSRGILISPESVMSLSASLANIRDQSGRSRFQGEAAVRAAQIIEAQLPQLLDQGGMAGTVGVKTLRRIGAQEGMGDLNFVEMHRMLEGSRVRGKQFNRARIVQELVRTVQRSAGENVQAGTIMLQNMFKGLSWGQAEDMFRAEPGIDIDQVGTQMGREERFRDSRKRQSGAAFSTPAAVAARSNRRGVIGGEVEEPVLSMQAFEDQIAAAIVPAVSNVADQMKTAIEKGDYSGAAELLAKAIGANLPKAIDVVKDIAGDAGEPVAGVVLSGLADLVEELPEGGDRKRVLRKWYESIFDISPQDVRKYEAGKAKKQGVGGTKGAKPEGAKPEAAPPPFGYEGFPGPTSLADQLDAASNSLASAANTVRSGMGTSESDLKAGVG